MRTIEFLMISMYNYYKYTYVDTVDDYVILKLQSE